MGDQVKFKKGLSTNLDSLPIENGSIIFTTDDNKLYVDTDIRTLINNGGDSDMTAKLVGSAGGSVSTSAGSISLPTSDYDYAVINCVNSGYESFSTSGGYYYGFSAINQVKYNIFKGNATLICLLPSGRNDDTSVLPTTTLTLSGATCKYTKATVSCYITIELYKYT